MAGNRGYESLDAKSRLRLIEAASELLSDDGHTAFSARRIADRAELKPQLVHYYFRSMEELVVAVFHRTVDEYASVHTAALSSANPVRAIWELNRNLPVARLMTEFVALSPRYPLLGKEMRKAGDRFRLLQAEEIGRIYRTRGLEGKELEPAAVAMLLSTVARGFVIEDRVGVTAGHDGMSAFIGELLDRIDPATA